MHDVDNKNWVLALGSSNLRRLDASMEICKKNNADLLVLQYYVTCSFKYEKSGMLFYIKYHFIEMFINKIISQKIECHNVIVT